MVMSRLSRGLIWSVGLLALVLIMPPKSGFAQVPPAIDTAFREMLDAIRSDSYERFVAQADSKFKAGFTQKMFNDLSHQLAPRLQQGYSATYFGMLKQQGYQVYVWKLEFKDAQDDYLITLFIKDEKVSGFVTK